MARLLCPCGTCTKCKARERQRAWKARHPERAEEIRLKWYRAHRDEHIAKMTARARTPEGHAERMESARRWQQNNREKAKAHNDARHALDRGEIERKGCEICGERAQMHHDDYAKPLDVRWLCHTHHRAHHAQVRAAQLRA